MKYSLNLFLRILIAIILLVYFDIFYIIFTPLTLYPIYFLLKLFGYSPILQSTTIFVNKIPLVISKACVAGSAYALITLLILLTKDIKFKKIIKMLVLGSFLILIMNLFRLMFLILLYLNSNFNWFEYVHLFFWQVIATVYVVLVWIILIKKFKIKNIPIYSDVKYLLKQMKKT